jgi:hypothetical protein
MKNGKILADEKQPFSLGKIPEKQNSVGSPIAIYPIDSQNKASWWSPLQHKSFLNRRRPRQILGKKLLSVAPESS